MVRITRSLSVVRYFSRESARRALWMASIWIASTAALAALSIPTVATVGLDNAANAAVLAIQMLAIGNARLADALEKYRTTLKDRVMRTIEELRKGGFQDDV